MIFQDPMSSLHPFYRIGDQIVEAIQAHRSIGKAAARRETLEMLQHVGIPAAERRIDAYPHQLSGGMRQRVMIAMALINSPQLLIADEPTTALDVTVQAQILELIARLQGEFGTTVILITHDLGIVADVADDVAVMYGGRIVELASTTDALRPARDALHAGAPLLGPADGQEAAGAAGPDSGQPAVADQAPQGLRLPAAL